MVLSKRFCLVVLIVWSAGCVKKPAILVDKTTNTVKEVAGPMIPKP